MRKLIFIVILCMQWCGVEDAGTRPPSTTIDIDELLKLKRKPQVVGYFPNYGYEPYWQDGEFVLATTTLDPSISTSKKPTVCGEECNYLLQRIKEVCAHKSDHNPVHCREKCLGKPGDDLNYGFKTFATYCEFLDAQCRNTFKQARYVLIHIGKCRGVDDSFKPLWTDDQPVSRVKSYITNYYSRYQTTKRIKKPKSG